MTLSIALEFARLGIRMLTIAIDTSSTPLVKCLPEAPRESLGNQVSFPSPPGKPAEFAVLAKHIIENRMLSDEVIQLEGAIRMASK